MRWSERPEAYIIGIAVALAAGVWMVYLDDVDEHETRARAFRADGRTLVQAWMEAPEHRRWLARFRGEQDVGRGTVFQVGHRRGRAVGVTVSLAPWRFEEAFPGGLVAPARIGDLQTRLALETGRPPAELDAGARSFTQLLHAPDLDRLREASLPIESKLFIARHAPDTPEWAAARRLLEMLQRCVYDETAPLFEIKRGYRRYEGAIAVVPSPSDDVYLYRADAVSTEPYVIGDDRGFRLRYHGPGAPPPSPDAVWSGMLAAPLAGIWSVEDLGHDFERDLLFQFGFLPAMLLIGAFLAVRRQRRETRARAHFITELAHDLRTPVTALRMHAELFASGRAPAGAERRYAVTIARESERLSALLGNLLDLSRFQHGPVMLQREAVRVRDAVDHAVASFSMTYADRVPDLVVLGDDDAKAMASRAALERCLVNLLDNAAKYTELRTPIHLEWIIQDNHVAISVRDAGPGIPRRERRKLFRRYQRGKRAKRDAIPGTGIGLSLVRAMMNMMGGSVALADSETGAHFVLYLGRA